MSDFEKLGKFYLGRPFDLEARTRKPGLLLYDSKDLVTHAVCVGMTGSGKTGLCIGLLEEAAIDSIPALIIDPKGDMANLLLTFPELRGQDFLPWINAEEANKKGLTPEIFAEREADKWKSGLAAWGQNRGRIARFREATECLVYTPGSTAGLPVSILQSFLAPPGALIQDPELLSERVNTMATSLLNLVGIDASPLQSQEHILLANILESSWKEGRDLSLPDLIQHIQQPPFTKLGVMDLETVCPSKERLTLSLRVNNLLGAPGFSIWLEGQPLDLNHILYSPSGKPRMAIFSIAHLSDAERMFFVSLLLNQTVSWMRTQSGTNSLRALLYMDEVFGFFPPSQNPPSKAPMLTLLKQARAFGLGVVLASQNPVDLDYKGLGNAGTWFIGRLQTERDMARVLDGLEGAAAQAEGEYHRQKMETLLSGLGSRVFFMKNVHEDGPEIFETRWVMSYLRGPLTRNQIKTLMDPYKAALETSPDGKGPISPDTGHKTHRPVPCENQISPPILSTNIPQYFVPIRGSQPENSTLVYEPRFLASAAVHFLDGRRKIDETRRLSLLAPLSDDATPVDWDNPLLCDLLPDDLEKQPEEKAIFVTLPASAHQAKHYKTWEKDFIKWVYRNHTLELQKSPTFKATSHAGEDERDFRLRLQQLAREKRDAATEKLQKKYATKMARLQDRIRRAQQAVEREEEQAKQQKFQTMISVGSSLLSAFLGRKVLSRSTTGKATTAIRGISRSMKEGQDIKRAEENVEALQQQLEDLNCALTKETDTISSQWNAQTEILESILIRPKKTNIHVRVVGLGWAPYWEKSEGNSIPAWQ